MRDRLKNLAKHYGSQLAMRQWFHRPAFCLDVEIETINRCNGVCEFCPVNRNDDTRAFARMEDSLLERILLDLQSHDYTGSLALQSNNEPLMDNRIEDHVALAKRLCTKARHYLYTNGTLLTYDRLMALFEAGLDTLVIDNYSEDLQVHPHIKDILERLKASPKAHFMARIELSVLSPKEVRANRGGQAPNKPVGQFSQYLPYRRMGCMAPFHQLIIRPTGEVSLCCQDALGKYTLGNAAETMLDEIWYGPKLMAVRRSLLNEGRHTLDLCKECDISPVGRDTARKALLRLLGR